MLFKTAPTFEHAEAHRLETHGAILVNGLADIRNAFNGNCTPLERP